MKSLGFLDRYLTVWIFVAIATGLLIGYYLPGSSQFIGHFAYGATNLLIALGLVVMMYPPLAKIDYSNLPRVFKNKKV
ncbi:arsenical-resistance protein [Piscirickettsia salmonis]|nr:hypothetical protein [Piscirickettsia salmonis]QGP55728.1 arsenical-resistance protein [Piscirickettsia salmonis]QGP58406.1 arsenical-resistance protein [Piscirickettsia salmonis]QGP65297.1 arsenical-resistance protein [Piscirickettsia salmonis]